MIGGELNNLCLADHLRILAHRSHKKRLASFFSGSRIHMFCLWVAVNRFPALRFSASFELIGLPPAKSEAF
jgi:hypothetical protein